MMQNDLGMVRHWIHPLKSGRRIEPRTTNVALESTGAEDLLQFVQPRQLQGQRMLGVLSSITAGKPPGDRPHAFAANYEPRQYSCRQGSRRGLGAGKDRIPFVLGHNSEEMDRELGGRR